MSKNKSVCITGGAGSLGKEFVELLHKDYKVTVIDNSEWAVAELRGKFPDVDVILDDFDHWDDKTDYLVHCAAYKHIDVIETDPRSSIVNNVYHSMKLFENCRKHKTKFLFISTDKAVEPISTYGMTKALGERLAWYYGGQVARSGNFLGSSGSAIPIWESAIINKEPIPITDIQMVRYVCDTKQAAKEMWEGFMAGNKLTIPTQRELKITDLVDEVLKRHGYPGFQDYKPGLKMIGIRPGEKLREKLRWDGE